MENIKECENKDAFIKYENLIMSPGCAKIVQRLPIVLQSESGLGSPLPLHIPLCSSGQTGWLLTSFSSFNTSCCSHHWAFAHAILSFTNLKYFFSFLLKSSLTSQTIWFLVYFTIIQLHLLLRNTYFKGQFYIHFQKINIVLLHQTWRSARARTKHELFRDYISRIMHIVEHYTFCDEI